MTWQQVILTAIEGAVLLGVIYCILKFSGSGR